MRWLALFLVLVVSLAVSQVGCWDLASGPAETSTGDAGSQCSQTEGCDTCTNCALSGPCAAAWDACNADAECLSIYECVVSQDPCDATCQANCAASDPDGVDDFTTFWNCQQCQQCPTACGLCSM